MAGLLEDPPVVLVCVECGCESDEKAIGWRAYLADSDDDGQEALCFCPDCAAREFGFWLR